MATAVGQAAREYAQAGWALVAFESGRKGPTFRGWNLRQRCITDPDVAEEHDGNVGLAHAYSRTCVIDVDDLAAAVTWFSGHGIDLADLMDQPDAVMISSGRKNRGKLLYALPPGIEPLPSKRPPESGVELRCATGAGLTVQDVLPPSVHPETGKPYVWKFGELGHWSALPVLPATVLELWQSMIRLPEPGERSSEPLGVAAERIRGILSRIDPDLEYNEWARVGAALHHESQGEEWGLDLWDEWSATGSKYKSREDLIPHWRSWGRYQGRPVTLQWLMGQAGGVDANDFDDLTQVPQQPPKPPRFEVLSLEAFASGKPPEWIIKGWLARAGLGILYGESGAGKSFLILDMMMSIARGETWCGKRVRQGRVIYICAEGSAGFRNRVKAYGVHHGLAVASLPVGVIADVPNLLTQDHQLLADRINAWGGADVVVIDTLAQTTPGSNENSSEDMGKALSHCRMLHAATGAMVVLVHHAGKDMTRGARGWSGIKAAADSELEVTRDGQARAVRVSKQKDGEDGLQQHFELVEVALGQDEDGDPVTSCVVGFVEAPEVTELRTRAPKGVFKKAVWDAALEGCDLCDGSISVDAVLMGAVERVPQDPAKKEDRRRDNAMRSLQGLVSENWLELRDGFVFVKGLKKPPLGGTPP
jgi:hypothetical protein